MSPDLAREIKTNMAALEPKQLLLKKWFIVFVTIILNLVMLHEKQKMNTFIAFLGNKNGIYEQSEL